jgi:uncharacterized membrane protein
VKKTRVLFPTSQNVTRTLTAITLIALVALVFLVIRMDMSAPPAYIMYNTDTIAYEKGTVTAVLKEETSPAEGMPGRELGKQVITVRIDSGDEQGREITLDNNLSTFHNVNVQRGTSVIVKTDRPPETEPFYSLQSYDRTPGLIAIAALFVALMLLVGRFKGLRSVLGLGISLFFIFAFLVPAIYRGWSPVWMAILTVIIVSVFSLLLLNGFSRKTLTAVVATASGVGIAALSFVAVSAALRLSGYDVTEAEELILISISTGLRVREALFAGVLIASLGAIIDTTVSMTAALYEIKETQPDISPQALFRSGMTIGRDIIGANCQTLILAFVGSSLAVLLVAISYGTQFDQFVSSNYLAVEVIHGFTGSFAVILSVPVTAALCAALGGRADAQGDGKSGKKRKKHERSECAPARYDFRQQLNGNLRLEKC